MVFVQRGKATSDLQGYKEQFHLDVTRSAGTALSVDTPNVICFAMYGWEWFNPDKKLDSQSVIPKLLSDENLFLK